MSVYWNWRYNRDKKLNRLYCEPDRTDEGMQKRIDNSLKEMSDFINEDKFKKVLDYGCGLGFYSLLFEDYLGVDIVPPLIEDNIKKYGNKFKLINTSDDLTKLGKFDLIFSVGVTQHIKDEQLTWYIRQFRRMSKHLIIFSPRGSIDAQLRPDPTKEAAPTCRHPVDLVRLVLSEGYRIKKRSEDDCKVLFEVDNRLVGIVKSSTAIQYTGGEVKV